MVFRTYTEDVLITSGRDPNSRSFTAEEDVLQGQLVKPGAAAYSVEPSDTDGELAIGFAAYSVSSGEEVSVIELGEEVLATSGTGSVSAGDRVASHGGTGEEGEVATAASGDVVIGVALEDDAGTNDDVRVLVTGPGGDVN